MLTALNPAMSGGHAGHDGGGAPAEHTTDETSAAQSLVSGGHGSSGSLGGMTQHIGYPLHLINASAPRPRDSDRGAREPGAATDRQRSRRDAYRFAVAGHELTVIAADGFDCVPTTTDTLIVGMAQRYDVLLTMKSGAWPIVAKVEGRDGYASTVLRSNDAAPLPNPDVGGLVPELSGRLLTESELRPADAVRLDSRAADRDYRVELIQAGDRYVWGMAGRDAGKLVMRQGERIRITMANNTTMWHPMHTHGHTFASPTTAAPTRHRQRATRNRTRHRVRRRQPWGVDVSLPQCLSLRSRDDREPAIHPMRGHP